MKRGNQPGDVPGVAYPLPWRLAVGLAWSIARGRARVFKQDAEACVRLLQPPLNVLGVENIPAPGPFLLTPNHYSRPGFPAWWIALGISAVVPLPIHWVMTAAWTFDRKASARPLVPLTRWLLRRIAQTYGFTAMPAMPPDPTEIEIRARAVRRVFEFARKYPPPVIGLAPEGMDIAAGVLGSPPSGAGRFISLLLPYCQRILPVGVYEESHRFCLRFGEACTLSPPDLNKVERDRWVSQAVMFSIAQQLPPHLRGEYR